MLNCRPTSKGRARTDKTQDDRQTTQRQIDIGPGAPNNDQRTDRHIDKEAPVPPSHRQSHKPLPPPPPSRRYHSYCHRHPLQQKKNLSYSRNLSQWLPLSKPSMLKSEAINTQTTSAPPVRYLNLLACLPIPPLDLPLPLPSIYTAPYTGVCRSPSGHNVLIQTCRNNRLLGAGV